MTKVHGCKDENTKRKRNNICPYAGLGMIYSLIGHCGDTRSSSRTITIA